MEPRFTAAGEMVERKKCEWVTGDGVTYVKDVVLMGSVMVSCYFPGIV